MSSKQTPMLKSLLSPDEEVFIEEVFRPPGKLPEIFPFLKRPLGSFEEDIYPGGKQKEYKCKLCNCYFKFDENEKAIHLNGRRHRHLYAVLFILLFYLYM